MDEGVTRLEEKIAYLERHVTEQDKAMLEMAGQLDRFKAELTRLKQRAESAPTTPDGGMADERPPHY